MTTSRIFLYSCLVFGTGVASANLLADDWRIFGGAIILIGLIILLFPKDKKIYLAGGLASLFLLTIIYTHWLDGRSLISNDWLRPIGHWLGLVKLKLEGLSGQLLPEPYAGLLNGLLLGTKGGLPPDVKEAFKITGLMHIVAVSGYNVTIVAAMLQSLLRPLPYRVAIWGSLGAILAFVMLTGAPASVIRAGIMGALVIVAKSIGRRALALNALVAAAGLMILIKPTILLDDIGFQLSVAATLGLIMLSPTLQKRFQKISWHKWLPSSLWEALEATLGAQALTIPIILYYFGRLSIISPLANVLVVPLVPWAMAAGFIGLVVGFLWQPLGGIVIWLGWGFLLLIIKLASHLADIPLASINLPKAALWLLIPYYLLLIWWVKHQKQSLREAKIVRATNN